MKWKKMWVGRPNEIAYSYVIYGNMFSYSCVFLFLKAAALKLIEFVRDMNKRIFNSERISIGAKKKQQFTSLKFIRISFEGRKQTDRN